MTANQDNQFLPPDPQALRASGGGAEPQGTPPRAAEALQKHHDALMGREGVVMIGETMDEVGRPAILIGVKTRKHLRNLPKDIDGVPVVAEVIGDVDAQQL
ncbi:MAG: hypothetical protein ABL957_10185 [Parvularculaceae bacterium]